MMSHRTLVFGLSLAITLVAGLRVRAEDPKRTPDLRPNILFILSDDHRWDALGAAGNEAIHTPRLDAMAKEGAYFPQATIHVSQCPPTRATLLTGLPPHLHGVHSGQTQDPRGRKAKELCGSGTVPSLLADSGYATILVGKWHLKPDPWDCGFGEITTWIPFGAAPYKDPEQLAQGRSREPVQRKGFTQEILTEAALEAIDRHAGRDHPFFLWAAFTAPHLPYAPNPPRIQKLYAGKTISDLLPEGFSREIPTNPNWIEYYEAVSHLDEQVGRLLDALAKATPDRKTVVIFLGDNGYMMGERGIGLEGPAGKVVPYESSLRVPLIVSGIPSLNGVDLSPVSSLDIPPTLLRIAGLEAPETWPGRDLIQSLATPPGITEAYSEWSDNQGKRFGHLAFRSVRTAQYKLIDWENPELADEFYDLIADPRETKNLRNSSAHREVAEDLQYRLQNWRQKTQDPTFVKSTGSNPTDSNRTAAAEEAQEPVP